MNSESLNVIQALFDGGTLKAAKALPVPMQSGLYHLHLYGQNGSHVAALEAQRGGLREFKTLDACASMARRIGFSQLAVTLR